MTNNEIYAGFASKNRVKAHSFMGVILKRTDIESLQKSIYSSLKDHADFILHKLVVKDSNLGEDLPILNLEWEAQIEYKEQISTIYLSIGKTRNINIHQMVLDRGVSQMQIEESATHEYFLFSRQLYSSDPLISFSLQIKVLAAIADDVILVLDFSSNRIFPSNWLEMTRKSESLPSPRFLYLVNIINNRNEDGEIHYWLRTNGLYRCGSPELEIINIKQNVEEVSHLLHATANRFIQKSFSEKQVIPIGYDGLEMNVSWQRWEDALEQYPNDAFGGMKYRNEDVKGYNKFRDPSGVLFAVEDGIFTSPEIYLNALKDGTLFYIDPNERRRQKSVSLERFSYFLNAYEEYGTKTFEDFPEISYLSPTKSKYHWQFLVRLDMNITNDNDYRHMDELWFEVLELHGDSAQVKQISSTYWSKDYQINDIRTVSLREEMSYWIIMTPDNTKYTPENIYLLNAD